MKKFLAILAVAGVMTACNNGDDANGEDTTTVSQDTTTVVTPSIDTTATTGGDTTATTGGDTTGTK